MDASADALPGAADAFGAAPRRRSPTLHDRFYRVVMGEYPPAYAAALRVEDVSPHGRHLEFTGTGAEYFRLWVVNAALTLLTLGIYSAWAKVRKVGYFARNTRAFGDPLHFTANPWAILRGRQGSGWVVGAQRHVGWRRSAAKTSRLGFSRFAGSPRRPSIRHSCSDP